MQIKSKKNSEQTNNWFSSLFILIFLLPTIIKANYPNFNSSINHLNKLNNQTNDQIVIDSQDNDDKYQNNSSIDIKIRKQRNSFMKNELNHQIHHFHNKYYSSIGQLSTDQNYRSSDSNYIPYRSLEKDSLAINSDSLTSSSFALSLSSSNLQSQTSSRLNKLNGHHSQQSIQGPIFQQDLPAKVSFSNNTGLILKCLATGQPQPTISWQTETGISVLNPSQTIDSLNLLSNDNSKYLPLVHQNSNTNALVFRSFASDEFSPEVHSTKYRCLATNIHGTITSSLVQVKAGM